MLHRVRNSLHRKQTPKCLHDLKTTSLSSFLHLLHFPSCSTIFLASVRVICRSSGASNNAWRKSSKLWKLLSCSSYLWIKTRLIFASPNPSVFRILTFSPWSISLFIDCHIFNFLELVKAGEVWSSGWGFRYFIKSPTSWTEAGFVIIGRFKSRYFLTSFLTNSTPLFFKMYSHNGYHFACSWKGSSVGSQFFKPPLQ